MVSDTGLLLCQHGHVLQLWQLTGLMKGEIGAHKCHFCPDAEHDCVCAAGMSRWSYH